MVDSETIEIGPDVEPVQEEKTEDGKLTQQMIPGTYDPPNPAVQEAAQEYVELLTTRMKTQERENVARATLIERMHEHDVHECHVEGYKVTIKCESKEKIVIKKMESADAVVESAD